MFNVGPEERKKQNGALDYRQGRRNETPQAIIRKLGNLKKQNSSPVILFLDVVMLPKA